jgi:hypothetical protein
LIRARSSASLSGQLGHVIGRRRSASRNGARPVAGVAVVTVVAYRSSVTVAGDIVSMIVGFGGGPMAVQSDRWRALTGVSVRSIAVKLSEVRRNW